MTCIGGSDGVRGVKAIKGALLDTNSRRKLQVSPVISIVQIEWLECWENAMFGTRKRYDLEYQN